MIRTTPGRGRPARDARGTALDLLRQVEEAGAYAQLALSAALRRAGLTPRDRALCTELVYGVLRWRGRLDYILSRFADRPLADLADPVRQALRLGAYQLFHLDRIPPAAAIDTAVQLVKERLHAGAAGYVNAVLRRVAREGQSVVWPEDPVLRLAAQESHPEWLVQRWADRFGLATARAICQSQNAPAPTTLRTNTLVTSQSALQAALAEEGIEAATGLLTPEALLVAGGGDLGRLSLFQEGHFMMQGESSQLVSHVLAPREGERIADLCSAPGGKTTHCAQLMRNRGEILAFDVHPHRVRLVAEAAHRLHITIIQTAVHDARRPPEGLAGALDRVLVDAPCSGTGVLRRRVDLRWRLTQKSITSLAPEQRAILAAAARLVRPGGFVCYATCSLEPEENEENTAWFLAAHPEFLPVTVPEDAAGAGPGGGSVPSGSGDRRFFRYILPHEVLADGFFIALFQRKPE